MKLTLLIFTLSLFTTSFGQSKEYTKMLSEYYNDFPTVTIEEASNILKTNEAIFLDIREESEFNVSHIKYARRMNPDGSGMKSLKGIDKSTKIIVYCSIGARSQSYGEMLTKKGYTNVHNMYGGLFHWANSNLPVVDIYNQATKNVHGYNLNWGKWLNKNAVY